MDVILVPEKKTGKAAIFQTRDEAAIEAKELHGVEHEIVRKGDHYKRDGADALHRPDAVTEGDIRIVVPNGDGTYAYQGPWNKPDQQQAMADAWAKANA